MNTDHSSKLEKLQALIKKNEALSQQFADASDLEQLKKIIRKPGWTTPAELRLVLLGLETIHAQLENVISLRSQLVKAADLVGTEVYS
jgi:hypothetical protein